MTGIRPRRTAEASAALKAMGAAAEAGVQQLAAFLRAAASKMITCPVCDGGKTVAGGQPCPACNGLGEVPAGSLPGTNAKGGPPQDPATGNSAPGAAEIRGVTMTEMPPADAPG